MKTNGKKLAAAVGICLLAGIIGSVFTVSSIPAWYNTLNKPSFSPPNWLFGPVWTMLYVLMGVAAYLVWTSGAKDVKPALYVFGLQLILNTIWSVIFFGMRNPLYAFIEIILLWITIALTLMRFYKIRKAAAYLMIPYICWVTFAALLNYEIWRMNM